ncbi:MAG: response regulator [Planctomycetes bacterium]|nr:response regulator [Planctomycetota bacterium]
MAEETIGVVLIIEDEAELRFVVNAHLRAAGFDVLEAGDAATGLALAAAKCPDLVIMDIGLPGMDGIEATKALRRDCRTRDIPIIMLTGRTGAEDVVRGLEAGAEEYLAKPFDLTELLARVRTVHRLAQTHGSFHGYLRSLDSLSYAQKRAELVHQFKNLGPTGVFVFLWCVEEPVPSWEERNK